MDEVKTSKRPAKVRYSKDGKRVMKPRGLIDESGPKPPAKEKEKKEDK